MSTVVITGDCADCDAPIAAASSNPVSGDVPLTVTFDASGSVSTSGAIVSYAWNFGDGSTATGVTATHTFTQAGTKNVSVLVTNAFGAASTTTISVATTEFVEPAPVIIPPLSYTSYSTVPDSLIQPLPTLGIGSYEISLMDRGGSYRIASLDNVTSISFGRRLDDTSEAQIVCISEEWADLIHPWQHEIHIFRNGELVWCGPVRDKTYDLDTGTVTIDARDLFSWFDFRVPHTEIDLSETDMTDVFVAVMQSAIGPDPSPMINVDPEPTKSQIDYYYDPEEPKIAADILRELANSGVDFTTVNRTVIVRPETTPSVALGPLMLSHLKVTPSLKESGEMGTLLLLTGSGGDYHSHPDKPLTKTQWGLHPFGLLERVIDATAIFDSDDPTALEKASESRYALVKNPRVFISDCELDPTAPVTLADLVPGSRIDVWLDGVSFQIMDTYRLQSLSVTMDGASESVSLELTSLGDFDSSTPL